MLKSLIIVGLIMGSIYGLIGLGYSIIFRASGITNLAQGEMITLSAFLGVTFYRTMGLPYIVSLLLTMLIMSLIGFLMQKGLIAQYQKLGVVGVSMMLCTLSVMKIVNSAEEVTWSANAIGFPSVFSVTTVNVLGAALQPEKIMCFFLAVTSMFLVHLLMTKTKVGKAMRACAMDAKAAESRGIDVTLSNALTWALASMVAAMCGMMLGPIYGVSLALGANISQKGFASAIAGGFGNIYGAMIGGILLGLVESLVGAYVGATLKDLMAYLLLFLILILRPTGLLNEQSVRDV